jgi:hypothetical protein
LIELQLLLAFVAGDEGDPVITRTTFHPQMRCNPLTVDTYATTLPVELGELALLSVITPAPFFVAKSSFDFCCTTFGS